MRNVHAMMVCGMIRNTRCRTLWNWTNVFPWLVPRPITG
jgi:hypothetical protein